MSADIGPGTVLLCVGNVQNACIHTPSAHLTVGAIYTCEMVSECRFKSLCPVDGCGCVGVQLRDKGLITPGFRVIYCPSQFKPFDGGDELDAEHEADEYAQLLAEAKAHDRWKVRKGWPLTPHRPVSDARP